MCLDHHCAALSESRPEGSSRHSHSLAPPQRLTRARRSQKQRSARGLVWERLRLHRRTWIVEEAA